MRLIAAAVVRTSSPLNALAILKIQVLRDRGKELADSRRFALATNIEVYSCNPQSPRQRGSKVTFEEGPVLAQSGRSYANSIP
jgi:IS30 family transposase